MNDLARRSFLYKLTIVIVLLHIRTYRIVSSLLIRSIHACHAGDNDFESIIQWHTSIHDGTANFGEIGIDVQKLGQVHQ
jgi:hypothetical protein